MADYLEAGYDNHLVYQGGTDTLPLDSLSESSSTGAAGDIGTATSNTLSNPTTDLTNPLNIDSGSMQSQLTFDRLAHIKGGATGYNVGTGFFIGWDSTVHKFFIGNSAGNKMTWDGTTLTVTGSFVAGDIHIPDIDTTASSFHVESDGSFWVGATSTNRATAPIQGTAAGVISVGNTGGAYINIDGPNLRIRTSNYVADSIGWSIDPTLAEFANVNVRGEFHTQVLSYNEKHASAGTSILARSAGKLRNDATSVTSPTTFNVDIEDPATGHTQVFAVGSILNIKDGSGVENWWTVSSVSDQTTFYRYVCTKSSGTNATFRAGGGVIDWGASGQGLIYSTVDDSNSPRISILTHAGSPWSTTTERLRVGNLNGFLDYASDLYGFAVGSTTEFVKIDPTNGVRASGKLVTQDDFTTGHAIDQGDAVSSESGSLYKTRIKDWSSNGTATNYAFNPITSNTTTKRGRFIDVSSTVKLALVASGNVTNDITVTRVVCSPSSSSITSATLTIDVNTTAMATTADTDGCLFDTNRVFVAYTDAVGGAIYGKVLSGLDTTVTLNTEATVAAASNNRCAVVKVSTTEVLVIYTDASDNIVATSCTIDGANAITVGSTQTILSDANVLEVRWAERFAATTAYAINFYDSTNTTTYVIAFTYSGTYSIGSQTSVVAALTRMSMASMGDDAMIMTGSTRSYGMTRSGTTLTVGSNTAIGAGNFSYVTRMGNGNAICAWRNSAGDIRYQAMDMDTTSRAITLLGSAGTVDTTGGEDNIPMMVKLSPSRTVVWRDNTSNAEMAVAVIDWTTNYAESVGIASADAASGASLLIVQAGTSDDVTGLTTSTEYFADCGGGLTTSTLGGSKHFGVTADSTTELIVQLGG